MTRRLGTVLLGIVISLLAIGLSLELLLLPTFTRILVPLVDAPARAGLSEPITLQLAEDVRAYVAGPDPSPLPAQVGARVGFDESQVSHLDDVAAVMRAGRVATIVCLLVVVASTIVSARRARWGALYSAMKGAGLGLMLVVPVIAVAGLTSFDALFAGFHGLFFDSGTWTFPSDALIIQLFPETFWAIAGASWGLVVMVCGAGLYVGGGLLTRRATQTRTGGSGEGA